MTDTPLGSIMTLDRSQGTVIPQLYGVKMMYLWNIVEASHYISLILHMEMGLVNLGLNTMINFIYTNIENISKHEQQEREK